MKKVEDAKVNGYERKIPDLTQKEMLYDVAVALHHIMNVQTEILNQIKRLQDGKTNVQKTPPAQA